MKARVKATGDIIEISEDCSYLYAEYYDKSYNLNELEFLDVKEKSFPKDDPDYWTRLEHQYAGMAMQGMLSNENIMCHSQSTEGWNDFISENAMAIASTLVERMKKEERK